MLSCAWHSQSPSPRHANRAAESYRKPPIPTPAPKPSQLSQIPNNTGVTFVSNWFLLPVL